MLAAGWESAGLQMWLDWGVGTNAANNAADLAYAAAAAAASSIRACSAWKCSPGCPGPSCGHETSHQS